MSNENFLFEVKTVYNQNTYKVLVQMMLRRLRRWPRFAVLTLGFGTLFLAGYRLFSGVEFDLVSALFLLFGNALIIFGAFAEFFLVQMLCAETGKKNPLVNRYRFYPEEIEIIPSSGPASRLIYKQIYRILEYKHFLFLFVDGGTTYILDPSSITKGTEQKLRDFLNQQLLV